MNQIIKSAERKYNRSLRIFIVISFLIIVLFHNATSQIRPENPNVIWQPWYKQWLGFTDSRNHLYHHIASEAFDLLENRENEISKINSLAEWQERQEQLKKTLLDIVGPFPEKTPLNAKIVKVIKKEKFTVEHIVFESQPQFYVTSSLFIPNNIKKNRKNPAIVYCSGHTQDGYRSYQHVIINLVNKGFIVFAFDPIGQGERMHYYDPELGRSMLGKEPNKEHSYSGIQANISGSSMTRYFVWDGIRAVDYLLTRKEVDPSRIGMTGQSGGGTQSTQNAAMDDRIYAVAIQSYITSYKRLYQSIGPQDSEQNLYTGIEKGIDHADHLSVRAPKPAIVLSTTEDMVSIQGARETAREVSRVYKAFGKEENFSIVEDIGRHGYTKKTREATYAFFQKHLNLPGNPEDERVTPLTAEEMKITPTGQTVTSLGGENVFSINSREAIKNFTTVSISRADNPEHLDKVIASAKELSGYKKPAFIDKPVFTGQIRREGYVIDKYFIKGEGNYIIPYFLMKPESSNNKAILYLHPSGKAEEAVEGGEMEWFVKQGFTILSPDLLGQGEMGPLDFVGGVVFEGISFNPWIASMHVGKSILGIRTGDVIRLANLLQKETGISEIYGFARKEMSPVILHAAAFEPVFARVALIEPFSSYMSMVTNKFYRPEFVNAAVPGAVKAYDLADLAASVAPQKLLIAGVTDGNGNTNDTEKISRELEFIRTVYNSKNKDGELSIIIGRLNRRPYDIFSGWIK